MTTPRPRSGTVGALVHAANNVPGVHDVHVLQFLPGAVLVAYSHRMGGLLLHEKVVAAIEYQRAAGVRIDVRHWRDVDDWLQERMDEVRAEMSIRHRLRAFWSWLRGGR